MAKKLVVNTGFITNSSSCVYHFDLSMLEHPDAKAFLEKYEIEDGYVGKNMWHRSECDSIVLNDEQKVLANRDFKNFNYESTPKIDMEESKGAIVFGDEYTNLASEFMKLLRKIEDEVEGELSRSQYYN